MKQTTLLRRALFLTLVLAGFGISKDAQAQSAEPREENFEDADLIDGEMANPYTDLIGTRRRGVRRTLIRPRTTFVRELTASVEDL